MNNTVSKMSSNNTVFSSSEDYFIQSTQMACLNSLCLTQEQKEAEIRMLRQSLNFKATPMPGFYRGPKMSKGISDKVYHILVQLQSVRKNDLNRGYHV